MYSLIRTTRWSVVRIEPQVHVYIEIAFIIRTYVPSICLGSGDCGNTPFERITAEYKRPRCRRGLRPRHLQHDHRIISPIFNDGVQRRPIGILNQLAIRNHKLRSISGFPKDSF